MSPDLFATWLNTLKPGTRTQYGNFLTRLFKLAKMTPRQVLDRVKAEAKESDATTYAMLVNLAKAEFTPRTAYITVYAIRRFLYDNSVQMLPPARTTTPARVKPSTIISWEQASRICDAASKPYNLALKVMLHCGWGIGEFLRFNTNDTWNNVKAYLASNPNAEYFRFDYAGRKRSTRQFYSLIPVTMLREVLGNIAVPIRATHGFEGNRAGKLTKTEGPKLDVSNYRSATKYIEHAFKTALKRAPVTISGNPSVHELRDTFRTRAAIVGASSEAPEFVMGHTIDPLGYNKIFYNTEWLWSELKKIYGPQAASRDELAALKADYDKRLKEAEEKLEDARIQMLTLLNLSTRTAVQVSGYKRWRSKEFKRRRPEGENVEIKMKMPDGQWKTVQASSQRKPERRRRKPN